MSRKLFQQHFYFVLVVLGTLLIFWKPLRSLADFSLTRDYGSHILLVPPTSAYLIYLRRRNIFAVTEIDFLHGIGLLLPGAILGWTAHVHSSLHADYLSLAILALIVVWISEFLLCYGKAAFRAARFPLLFLALMIPIPDFLMGKIIFALQAGSAAVAYWLFEILGVPAVKEGLVFFLPNLDIEVAKQCSGIHSSIALLFTTLLLGEFTLCSFWRKLLLVLSAVPILFLKNGVRIVTISLLTIYVDRRFLHGWIHTSGGVVFYALGLLSLYPIVLLLKTGEAKSSAGTQLLAAPVNAAPRPEIGIPESYLAK